MNLAELLASEPSVLRASSLRPVEVAVLDSGIDSTHSGLLGRVDESFEVVSERDRLRLVARPVPGQHDAVGHGTGVASVIARLAPNARIVDVGITASDAPEAGAALLEGLELAALRQTPVVNLSVACHPDLEPALAERCDRARSRGQLLVAARRNLAQLDHGLPARLSSCIGVDGHDAAEACLRFQDRSPIEFSAPGSDVSVAVPGGGTRLESGTSFAAPVVSAACALLLGVAPGLAPFEVATVLKRWAERGVPIA